MLRRGSRTTNPYGARAPGRRGRTYPSIAATAVAVVLAVSAVGCGSGPGVVPVDSRDEAKARAQRQQAPRYYKVQKGDTLYSISWRYGYDYHQVAKWNGISRPYTIYPGQKLRLRPPPKRAARMPKRTKKPPRRAAKPAPKPAKPDRANPPAKRASSSLRWVWPAKGRLLRRFSSNDSGKKGIAIAGRSGQPVRAASSGEVVYSGSGLIRYGNLIIIKHDAHFFSAYAHNQKLLVQAGEHVKAGQGIAHMGSTGTDRTMLHFEIRRNGKPVDPLRYLPKR